MALSSFCSSETSLALPVPRNVFADGRPLFWIIFKIVMPPYVSIRRSSSASRSSASSRFISGGMTSTIMAVSFLCVFIMLNLF